MPSAIPDSHSSYERLCRGWWGLNGRGVIWLGADHLLHSSSTFAVESYKRWYFRDVQALLARRTIARLLWNLIAGGIGLFLSFGAASAIVAGSAEANPGNRLGFFILAGFLGVIAFGCLGVAAWNTLLGPTCSVRIVTPRGMEKLPGIGRTSTFEKLVTRLQPLTEAASQNAGLRTVATALESSGQ